MENKLEFLKSIVPFNLLSNDILLGIIDVVEEISYSKETLIYQQEATKMKGVELIVEGEYESFFYDSNNHKRDLEILKPGQSYGGISVLLNRKKSLKTVIAKKGTLVYFLPRKDFKSLCNAYEHFYQHFTRDFGNRMLDEEFAHFYRKPASFEESYIASEQLYSKKIEQLS